MRLLAGFCLESGFFGEVFPCELVYEDDPAFQIFSFFCNDGLNIQMNLSASDLTGND